MSTVHIHGLGHFHPENVVDNRFLEALDIGTTNEWILDRVGIRERRTVLPLDYIRATRNADVRAAEEAALYNNIETGRRAALMALDRAGLSPKDIGLVVAGGCCPSMSIPADACRIAAALGIDAVAFDINSACSSFGAQLHLISRMSTVSATRPDAPYALVVNAENTTRVVDYADRSTAVLWGDGTSAAVVSTEVPSRVRVVGTTLASSPAGCDAVAIPRYGHFRQEGSAVQRFAIRTSSACLSSLLPWAKARAEQTGGQVHYIGHQANLTMLESVARRAALAATQHWHNIETFGNTGAAGAPTVLSQRWDELVTGDTVLLVVVGAGLSWSSMQIEIA